MELPAIIRFPTWLNASNTSFLQHLGTEGCQASSRLIMTMANELARLLQFFTESQSINLFCFARGTIADGAKFEFQPREALCQGVMHLVSKTLSLLEDGGPASFVGMAVEQMNQGSDGILVSGFLTEITQQIHSLRASGVISSHFARAAGSGTRAFRKSAGKLWTTPAESLFLIPLLYEVSAWMGVQLWGTPREAQRQDSKSGLCTQNSDT